MGRVVCVGYNWWERKVRVYVRTAERLEPIAEATLPPCECDPLYMADVVEAVDAIVKQIMSKMKCAER